MFRADFAWAAGFFDGEGCFSSAGRTPVATVSQTALECLDVFASIVGIGTIKGPYDKATASIKRRPQWVYYIYGPGWVESLLAALWPWLGMSKRAQGMLTLPGFIALEDDGFESLPLEERLAWAGGFFDGEGCFSHCGTAGLQARITHTDHALLQRFRDTVRIGKIYGPYRPHHTSFGRKDQYVYTAFGFERVQALLASLWPNVGSAKRSKAMRLLNDYRFFWKCGHRRGPVWKYRCPRCSKKTGPRPGSKRTEPVTS